MTRRRSGPPPAAGPLDPITEALVKDAQGVAGDLSDVFASLKGYEASQVYGVLYKKPEGVRIGYQGKFQWIEDLAAPFDFTEIYSSLKARFGGGDYRMTIMAAGKLVKQHEFSIYGPALNLPTPGAREPANDAMKPADMLALMMTQAAEARREAQDQQRFFMEQQSARDARLMQTLGIVIPVVAPLLFGGREKLSDLVAMMAANRPPETNLKETVETFAALRSVFGGEGGAAPGGLDFNPDDIVGSIGRMAGPMLAAAGRAFNGRGEPAPAQLPPPEGDGLLHLPGPAAFTLNPPAPAASGPRSPLLELVKPHVAYFFNAHLDPGLAAEAVSDIMARAQVTEADLNELVAAFTLSADWLADLAGQGLDLRSNPAWASDFLRELVAAWNDGHGDGGDSDGPGGRVADHAPDAGPGAARLAVNGDSRPGA
jgi:hypothetical protein